MKGSKELQALVSLPQRYPVVLVFIFFFLLALLVSGESLGYPFFYDDLHLMHSYSPQELSAAFTGNWEPDEIETPGYRPLTTLFNHLRYSVFGEEVFYHRLFQIFLFALYLASMCWIARQFGQTWAAGLLAGSLLLLARYNIPHVVWITDGMHALQAALFGLSVACLLLGLQRKSWFLLLVSLALVVLNMFGREDSVVLTLIAVVLGYIYSLQMGLRPFLAMNFYAFGCFLSAAVFLMLRALFVPASGSFPAAFPTGLLTLAESLFGLTGITAFDPVSLWLLRAWPIMLLFIVGLTFFKRYRLTGIWLACFVIAILGLLASGFSRTNLLLFPLTFFCLGLAAQLEMIHRHLNYGRVIAALLGAWLLFNAWYFHPFALESLHPKSTTWIRANASFVYGEYSASATIPARHLAAIKTLLALSGVNAWEDVAHVEALAQERHDPTADGAVFSPYINIFTP